MSKRFVRNLLFETSVNIEETSEWFCALSMSLRFVFEMRPLSNEFKNINHRLVATARDKTAL